MGGCGIRRKDRYQDAYAGAVCPSDATGLREFGDTSVGVRFCVEGTKGIQRNEQLPFGFPYCDTHTHTPMPECNDFIRVGARSSESVTSTRRNLRSFCWASETLYVYSFPMDAEVLNAFIYHSLEPTASPLRRVTAGGADRFSSASFAAFLFQMLSLPTGCAREVSPRDRFKQAQAWYCHEGDFQNRGCRETGHFLYASFKPTLVVQVWTIIKFGVLRRVQQLKSLLVVLRASDAKVLAHGVPLKQALTGAVRGRSTHQVATRPRSLSLLLLSRESGNEPGDSLK